MKKRRIVVPIILLALACPVIPGFDSGLKVRCYTVESDAVQAPVRVALISDLHSCGYGENQREKQNSRVFSLTNRCSFFIIKLGCCVRPRRKERTLCVFDYDEES